MSKGGGDRTETALPGIKDLEPDGAALLDDMVPTLPALAATLRAAFGDERFALEKVGTKNPSAMNNMVRDDFPV